MKLAPQQIEKLSARRGRRNYLATAVTLAVVLWLAASASASAQTSRFYFDRSGNLRVQMQTTTNLAAPQIVHQPQLQIVPPGGRASFSVAVADPRGLSYQWLFSGNPISGATADTLLLTNVSAASEGVYSVFLQNSVGAVSSSQAPLYLDADADSLPDSWENTYFGGATTTYGDTDGDGISNLQEFYDGTNPTNAASALYRITLYRDGGAVQVSPNQTAFPKDQVVTLTAIGSDATPFHAWTGDIVSRSNSLTFTINTNLTLFAHFQPFTLQWTNVVSGDWNAATNWTPNLIPSTNEDALLPNNVTVTENSNVALHNLTLTSGTLAVNGNMTSLNSTLTSATATFNGGWACSNNLTISSATVTFNGPGAAVAQNFSFNSGILRGTQNVTVLGAMTWTVGSMLDAGRTIIASNATLNINNPGELVMQLGRTLDNAGTVNWSGGAQFRLNDGYLGSGGYITNEPGAVFNVLAPQQFYTYSSTASGARFDNAGTLRIPGGGTTPFDQVLFNNYGLVDIASGGTLALRYNNNNSSTGTNRGSINVSAGATFNLAGGVFNAGDSSIISGGGALLVSGNAGTHTLAGIVALADTNTFTGGTTVFTGNYVGPHDVVLAGGNASFTGDYTCTNNLVIVNSAATFSGTGTAAPQNVTFNGGSLRGTQTVTVLNAMTWTGGFMRDAARTIIAPGATLTINNTSDVIVDLGRALDNAGTVNWNGGASFALNYGPYSAGGYVTNELGGVFNVLAPQQFYNLGGSGARFDNAGTLRFSTGGTASFYGVPLNNYNLVDVSGGGTLMLDHNSTLTIGTNVGVINISAGATFNLTGYGGFSALAGSTISGAGSLLVSGGGTHTLGGTVALAGTNIFTGGTANFTGNYICTNNLAIAGGTAVISGTGLVAPQHLIFTGGTLRGTQNVTVGNTMLWTSGLMRDAGRTIIAPGATLTINNTSDVFMDWGRALDNAGTVNWSGGAAIELNYGPYDAGAYITNEPGAVFTVLNPQQFYNGAGAGARFDNAGTLHLPGGTTTFNGVPLTNYNFIDLHTGALAANSGYVSTSNSVLYSVWAGTNAGVNYGQLRVSDTAQLAGTVSVGFTNGYVPAIGDAFTLVSAGARSGNFSSFLYPSNQIQLTLNTTPTAIIATVANVFISPTAPVLHLDKSSESSIEVSWSTSFPGYHLQYVTLLTDTNWVDAGFTPSVVGTNFVVPDLLSNTRQQRFYRLSNQ